MASSTYLSDEKAVGIRKKGCRIDIGREVLHA